MPLIERVMGLEEGKIPVHDLAAALGERLRGKLTNAQLDGMFEMDNPTRSELATLRQLVNSGARSPEEVEQVLVLAERERPGYSTPTEVRSKLGL